MAEEGGVPAPAGYSGTGLVRKLGIKPGSRIGLIGAPEDFGATLGELPGGAAIRRRVQGPPLDVIVVFSPRRVQLIRRLPGSVRVLAPGGGLWIAWPKRTSGVHTDVSERQVRELGLATGLVDNKVCAIDQVWSGLRFVHRRPNRS